MHVFSPGQKLDYLLQSELPYLPLDYRTFEKVKVNEADAEAGRRRVAAGGV